MRYQLFKRVAEAGKKVLSNPHVATATKSFIKGFSAATGKHAADRFFKKAPGPEKTINDNQSNNIPRPN